MYAIRSYYVTLNNAAMTQVQFNNALLSLQDKLLYYALSLTADQEKAQDLLQETFLKARITSYNVCYTKLLRIEYSCALFDCKYWWQIFAMFYFKVIIK